MFLIYPILSVYINKSSLVLNFSPSVQLELGDINKGLLYNRVAFISFYIKATVVDAVDGLFVYNTATVPSEGLSPELYFWRSGNWNRVVNKLP